MGSHKTSSVTATDGPFGLFNYPAEIRTKIYRKLFVIDTPILFKFECSGQFLLASRQIHEEGRNILYSENCFIFGDVEGDAPSSERKMLPVIKKSTILLIRHIHIRGWLWGINAIDRTRVAEIIRMKHLQTIELRTMMNPVPGSITIAAFIEAAKCYISKNGIHRDSLAFLLKNTGAKVTFQALMPGFETNYMIVFFDLKLCGEGNVNAEYKKHEEGKGEEGLNRQLRWIYEGA